MRVLGLDFGDRTVGLAISDELGLTARGITTLRRGQNEPLTATAAKVAEAALSHGAEAVALGFPKHMNNTVGEQGRKTLNFKKQLEKALPGVPVYMVDERLTTASAERVLLMADVSREKRGKVIDKMAATIILQTYLDGINKNKEKEAIRITDHNNDHFDHEDEESVVVITDENGNEIEFIILDELTHEGVHYLLAVEADKMDEDEDETEAVIFKEVGEEGGEMVYEEPDDEEFDRVAKMFDARLDDFEIEF